MGISTPCCRDSARTAAAAPTPSATCPSSARTSGSDRSAREREADAPVARQVAGAGQHEIAQSREPHHRFAPAAERRAKAAGLREAARDEGGPCVVPEAETVARAGRDREHVLHRAGDLHARDVVALVGAQRFGAKQRRDVRRDGGVGRRDRDGRRQSASDLVGEARPGNHADRRAPHRREMLMRERDPRGMRGARGYGDEPLRQPEERRARAGGCEIARHARQRGGRRRDDDERRGRSRGERARHGERLRQHDARQVFVVAAPGGHRRRLRGVARPERHGETVAPRQVRGERGTPRARTDDGNRGQSPNTCEIRT